MNKLKLSRILLAAAILLIVAFQSYWLNRIYHEEWMGLKKDTNGILRDVVYDIQLARYKGDSVVYRQQEGNNLFALNVVNQIRQQTAAIKKNADSSKKDTTFNFSYRNEHTSTGPADSLHSAVKYYGIRGAALTPDVVTMMVKNQVTNVKLPPMVDTALLRRMSQSGMKVMVSFNNGGDSTVTLSRFGPSPAGSGVVITHRPGSLIKRAPENHGKPVTIKTENIPSEKAIVRMIIGGKPLADSLSIPQLDSIYKKELTKAGIPLAFAIKKGKADSLHWRDTLNAAKLVTGPRTVGLLQQVWYQAVFENPTTFLLKKISLQILFSLFLVAFTSITFLFLYRNLVAQRKLTEMKNDFISNITHELKTPLATVSVAVEALRNFGGIQNPQRTKEYLDISASELQRLSLLVDKVLKLSLFENRELELKKEVFDLKQLTEEVLNTMKLQFDTHHAKVKLEVQGNYFTIHADRLHITSVIFNLLDNALKYSKGDPEINIRLKHLTDTIVLQVEDNGIGIPGDFRTKIFDKFFRVPNGDHHNIKGYGLGLSYVAHVVKRHNGSISVESEHGKGSVFTVKFPVT